MNAALHRITRADALAQGITDRQLQRMARTGVVNRVRPGEFTLGEEWATAVPLERHRELVLRTAERVATPQVYSHHAAAALWGMRIWQSWPSRVDVLVERASGGRSSGLLRRHALGLEDKEITELDGLRVTSPAQTVIDLSRSMPFLDAVVVADSALGTAFGRAALTTHRELAARAAASERRRGASRTLAVLAASDARAESPPESASRVMTVLLGFPPAEPQKEFLTSLGRRRVDLWWDGFGLGGECDGQAKYTDPAMLGGRSPQEVFRREKERERALLAMPEVRGLVHWDPAELRSPARFYRILSAAGLPSRYGPPNAASRSHAELELIAAATRGPFARQP